MIRTLSLRHQRSLKSIALILGTALSYTIMGKLGLSLAVPPGYATAVFPASGLALVALLVGGYRLALGVWLGSFLMNFPWNWSSSASALNFQSIMIAAIIGFGAAAQAAISKFLIEKAVPNPLCPSKPKEIVLFLTISSALGCLISSSWGVLWLVLKGIILWENLVHSWFTWYVGDAIGVLIFAPLGLIFFGSVVETTFKKKVLLSLPLTISFTMTVLVYLRISRLETSKVQRSFHTTIEKVFSSIEKELSNDHNLLLALHGFYDSSRFVDRDEFTTFTRRVAESDTSIQAFEWIPKVKNKDISKFEEKVRAEGFPNFRVHSFPKDSESDLAHFPFAFPVNYIAPMEGNIEAFGLDLASSKERRESLLSACRQNKSIVTPAIDLVQGGKGILIFRPVTERDSVSPTNNCSNVEGFVLIVLKINELINTAISGFGLQNINIEVFEAGTSLSPRHIFSQPGGYHHTRLKSIEEISEVYDVKTLDFLGLDWKINFFIPNTHLWKEKSWATWFVLTFGMLFTGVLTCFLLVLVGRQRELEEEINIAEEKIRRQLELSAKEARLSSLGQMAGGVAHEINTPLAIIRARSELLISKLNKQILSNEDTESSATKIIEVVDRIAKITSGLRMISRDGSKEPCEFHEINDLMEETLSICREKFKLHEIKLHVDVPEKLCAYCNNVQISQILLNLLNNAFFEANKKSDRWVKIEAKVDDNFVKLLVTDCGNGINPHIAEKIFEPFYTTKPLGQGSGLGLSISRGLIRDQGGDLYYNTSCSNTQFVLQIPRTPIESNKKAI